jgi:CubicO group peptidase (beta-lactamase class C family)
MRLRLILLPLILLMSCWPCSQASSASQQESGFAELEKIALEELQETGTPGSAVAVVSGERVVFAKGFGESNINAHTPVKPEMLFRLGAPTKVFTAASLVMLAEEGKIRLDEPIGKYVKGLSPKLAQVTAHQLLTHTAGLKDESPTYGRHDETALADTVRSWKDDYCVSRPGQKFSHSNPGYWLAGFVIEQLTGKPFADQLKERLFDPLGMSNTTFRPTMAITFPFSEGHDAYGNASLKVVRPIADDAASWPSGSMFSSVLDLSRFAIAFMNGGKIDGRQILEPSLIAKISTPYIDIPGTSRKYGYGLIISDYRGVHVLRHGGTRLGYGSLLLMALEHRFAVISLANRSGVVLTKTAEKAFEMLLPVKPRPLPGPEIAMNEEEMARYAGVYTDPPGSVEISVNDGQLFFKQYGVRTKITKIANYRFTMFAPFSSQAEEIVLFPGSNGEIEYLRKGTRSFNKIPALK